MSVTLHCSLRARLIATSRIRPSRSKVRNSHSPYHSRFTSTPRPVLRSQRIRHAAVDLRTLILASATSLVVVYFGFAYGAAGISSERQTESQSLSAPGATAEEEAAVADMAASHIPPGRPGNLTAEQEAKLKEMWAQSLKFFGMSSVEVQQALANGTIDPPPPKTPTTPERKRRSFISRFSKRDKTEGEDESTIDNDKHGQVKDYEEALKSMTPEQIREAFWRMTKHDHPDALLLRFLRARKWDIQAAQVMSLSTLHWRLKDVHVDEEIMFKGEESACKESKSSNASEKKEGDDFMAQLRMGKSFLHGVDKEGRPICWVRARLHHGGEQSERSLEQFTVYTIETARMMLRPPVDTATIVFDMTDFSMANMDYTPVKFMIKCFEANYPESLGAVVVYKAPWIFQGIWKIIRGWLDPVVASKIHFHSNVEEMQELIPRSHIMQELGGDEAWTYQYVEPKEGENARMSNTAEKEKVLEERKELVKEYEKETIAWLKGENTLESRNRIAQQLSENYWKLDPFIRARSLYDRTGVLGSMGTVNFYPKNERQPAQNGRPEDELD